MYWLFIFILLSVLALLVLAFVNPSPIQKGLCKMLGRSGPWLLNGKEHYEEVASILPTIMELKSGYTVIDITPGSDILARTLAISRPDLSVSYDPGLLSHEVDAIVCYGGLVNEMSLNEWDGTLAKIMKNLKPGGWLWLGGILHQESKVPWFSNWTSKNGHKPPLAKWMSYSSQTNLVILPHNELFPSTKYGGLQSVFIQK